MLPVIIATIDGATDSERLVLSLVPCESDGSAWSWNASRGAIRWDG